jgi:hypothetical protein
MNSCEHKFCPAWPVAAVSARRIKIRQTELAPYNGCIASTVELPL